MIFSLATVGGSLLESTVCWTGNYFQNNIKLAISTDEMIGDIPPYEF